MPRHLRPTVLVAALVLSAAGVTDAGTQGAGAQGVSEALAELNALGLQVEVRATEVAGVQSTAVPLTSLSGAGTASAEGAGAASAETTANRVQESSVWERLRAIFTPAFQRTTDRLIQDAIRGIQDACRINLTADAEGFELASVGISLGGVTATFRPSPDFCVSNPIPDEQ